jgi:predicted RecB family nuclease
MILKNNFIEYSPNDLLRFLDSRFLSWMDRKNLIHQNKFDKFKVADEENPTKKLLFQEGIQIEKNLVKKLKDKYIDYVELDGDPENMEENIEETLEAMEDGVEIIFQGHLRSNNFMGISDVLLKQEGKSNFGDYYYTVKDIKRSQVSKSKFIIQVCGYCDLLEQIQGVRPKKAYILLGNGEEEEFIVNDYYNYYLSIKNKFINFQKEFKEEDDLLPEIDDNHWYWEDYAYDKLEELEDISLIANIEKSDIKDLRKNKINSLSDLSKTSFTDLKDISFNEETFYRLKKQAIIKKENNRSYEVLPHDINNPKGLCNLMEYQKSDLYLDVQYTENFGKEGFIFFYNVYYLKDNKWHHKTFDSFTVNNEEKTFKIAMSFVRDFIGKRGKVYHFGSETYEHLLEVAAKYDTFLPFIETLYFSHKFVDLEKIVIQSMVLNTHKFTLENISQLIGFDYREVEKESSLFSVKNFGVIKSNIERANNFFQGLTLQKMKAFKHLHEWMLKIQAKEEIELVEYSYDNLLDEEEDDNEKLILQGKNTYDQKKYQSASEEEKVRTLILQLLKFHRHESKPSLIEKQELLSQQESTWKKHPRCLSNLKFKKSHEIDEAIRIYSYNVKDETKIKVGDQVTLYQNQKLKGEVVILSPENEEIVIKFSKNKIDKVKKYKNISIMQDNFLPISGLERHLKSMVNIDEIDNLEFFGLNKCIYDFFMRKYPDINGLMKSKPLYNPSKELIPQAINIVNNMKETCLIFQGPPGAGKTYTSSNIIIDLIRKGKRVGISSNSHKAINNVLIKLKELDNSLNIIKLNSNKEEDLEEVGIPNPSNKEWEKGKKYFQIVGGTVFKFAKSEMNNYFDYLFIDEAGQVSLANLMAMSSSCKNLVLIGDQMQLEQPIQAIHPGESGKSALEYYLKNHKTIPENYGFFLPETRRMNNELTQIISKYFYEDKLKAHESSHNREVIFNEDNGIIFRKKGLQFVSVNHKDNTQYSMEEVDKIKEIVDYLLEQKINIDGQVKDITMDDIIMVSPYNMQVSKLKKVFKKGKIGSVDLFQGQEAPIVIISLASSSSGGRGIDFLLNENRINVALSRGKALAIIVASEEILTSSVDKLEELKLLNLFSELIEYKK